MILHFCDIAFDLDQIASFAKRSGVVRLYLFGSILTDRFGPDSDIDMIVETDPLRPPGLLALGGLQMDLSELLGRRLHLTSLGGVPVSEHGELLGRARLLIAP